MNCLLHLPEVCIAATVSFQQRTVNLPLLLVLRVMVLVVVLYSDRYFTIQIEGIK